MKKQNIECPISKLVERLVGCLLQYELQSSSSMKNYKNCRRDQGQKWKFGIFGLADVVLERPKTILKVQGCLSAGRPL